MKYALPLFLLIGASQMLFGQTNPFKDEKIMKDNERRFIVEHKIKEVDEYVVVPKDSLKTRDSSLICKFYYDKKGNITKTVRHIKMYSAANREGKDFEEEVNYAYEYNASGQLSKINYTDNEMPKTYTTTYDYDSRGNLVKQYEAPGILVTSDPNFMAGINLFEYDDAGNVTSQKRFYDSGQTPGGITTYTYNSENQLVKSASFKGEGLIKTGHKDYQYIATDKNLTRLEDIYNSKDSLKAHNEYVYDANNNQVKGYNTRKGVKFLVWDYTYNDKNQLTESKGGPSTLVGLDYKDVRRDGLAHLFYKYDKDDNLIQIKKYETDVNGMEKLTAIEKLVYKKY